jgi:hypothetical protein
MCEEKDDNALIAVWWENSEEIGEWMSFMV